MDNKICCFDKKTTNVIKGILLIFMFILHFFCFPSWYINGIDYPNLLWMEKFQGHFQICISGFTFLTGYLYFFTKKKNFKYVVKKWRDILIPYWIVFGILLTIAIFTDTYPGNLKSVFLEVVALERPVMFFCWYVSYYILMIIMLWFLVKYLKNDFVLLGVALVGSFLIYYGASRLIKIDFIISTLEKIYVYFPITITGYVCAKRQFFEKIYWRRRSGQIVCSIFFVIIVFMEPSWLYGIKMDNIFIEMIQKCIRIISIPFFVYGLIIISGVYEGKIKNVFEKIGKYSMIMWFIHGIFFNCSKEVFQKILYLPKQPIIVLGWGVLLCYLVSIPLEYLSNRVRKI